jgi:hypothetical protein
MHHTCRLEQACKKGHIECKASMDKDSERGLIIEKLNTKIDNQKVTHFSHDFPFSTC